MRIKTQPALQMTNNTVVDLLLMLTSVLSSIFINYCDTTYLKTYTRQIKQYSILTYSVLRTKDYRCLNAQCLN